MCPPPSLRWDGSSIKDETDYAHTLRQLSGFYEPNVNVIAERYTFRQQKRSSTESTAEYVAALRGLTVNCQFGALTDELIRDQVVECTTHRCLRERFLQDSKLTLESVLSQAEAYEASQRQATIMTGSPSQNIPDVAKVSGIFKKPSSSKQDFVRYCGHCDQRHKAPRTSCCPARQATCYSRGTMGHWA